jgi:hypothetical protein
MSCVQDVELPFFRIPVKMSLQRTKNNFSFRSTGLYLYGKILDILPQAAPPEPLEIVKKVIADVGLSQSDVADIYQVFRRLRNRDGNRRLGNQMILSSSSTINVVGSQKEYVETMLKNILQLGGCYEFVDWDHFLYVFLRFCSLTRVELCQLLFLIIVRELKGLEVHYLTSTQLDRFYEMYRREGTRSSMNCNRIHFSNFPLARYYVADFVEICFLYSQLLNPIRFLQRQFQNILPSYSFWDAYDGQGGANRRIGTDFFLIKRLNVSMTDGNTFQETCDMLLKNSQLVRSREEDRKERFMEVDFISRNRKVDNRNDFQIDKVYQQLPNEGIIRKNIDAGTAL